MTVPAALTPTTPSDAMPWHLRLHLTVPSAGARAGVARGLMQLVPDQCAPDLTAEELAECLADPSDLAQITAWRLLPAVRWMPPDDLVRDAAHRLLADAEAARDVWNPSLDAFCDWWGTRPEDDPASAAIGHLLEIQTDRLAAHVAVWSGAEARTACQMFQATEFFDIALRQGRLDWLTLEDLPFLIHLDERGTFSADRLLAVVQNPSTPPGIVQALLEHVVVARATRLSETKWEDLCAAARERPDVRSTAESRRPWVALFSGNARRDGLALLVAGRHLALDPALTLAEIRAIEQARTAPAPVRALLIVHPCRTPEASQRAFDQIGPGEGSLNVAKALLALPSERAPFALVARWIEEYGVEAPGGLGGGKLRAALAARADVPVELLRIVTKGLKPSDTSARLMLSGNRAADDPEIFEVLVQSSAQANLSALVDTVQDPGRWLRAFRRLLGLSASTALARLAANAPPNGALVPVAWVEPFFSDDEPAVREIAMQALAHCTAEGPAPQRARAAGTPRR